MPPPTSRSQPNTKFCKRKAAFREPPKKQWPQLHLPEMGSVEAIGTEFTAGILHVTLSFDTEKVTKQHIEIRYLGKIL